MGWCTGWCKMLLFGAKKNSKRVAHFELAHLKKKKERGWRCGDFLVWYFRNDFSCHWACCSSWKHLEDEWYVVKKAYKFRFWEFFSYVECPHYPYIQNLISYLYDAREQYHPLLWCDILLEYHTIFTIAILVGWVDGEREREQKRGCHTPCGGVHILRAPNTAYCLKIQQVLLNCR